MRIEALMREAATDSLLEMLMEGNGGKKAAALTKEQMVLRLGELKKSVFALPAKTMQPGDIVQLKDGIPNKPGDKGRPYLLYEVFPPVREDVAFQVNCTLFRISDCGCCLQTVSSNTALIEPYSGPRYDG